MAGAVVDFILDFGTDGGSVAEATITGQAGLTSGAKIEPFFQKDSTADNTIENHALLSSLCKPIAGYESDGVFSVLAITLEPVAGTFVCHAVWTV
jgi:hypothetical protein